MLALRLARGARPAVQCRRLLVMTASGGTGFLLLSALGHALAHPGGTASALRLTWCLAPLAATVYLAVAVARTDPATRPRSGLTALGLGPVSMMLLSAVSTAVACSAGSLLALLLFLQLRTGLPGTPFAGAAGPGLGAGRPLPFGAVAMLLALVPATASLAGALALRPRSAARPTDAGDDPDRPRVPSPVPGGLPWGVALLAAGFAVETYAGRTADGAQAPLPGGLAGGAGVLAGWALTALGLAVAGPGLTYQCGRLLQAVRPGAARLLAGRVLQQDAHRVGRPLGLACAVASGAYAAGVLADGEAGAGPLTGLGALLVAGCVGATLLMAAVESRQDRLEITAALHRQGAPVSLLRGAVALRVGALTGVFGPLTWAVAQLAALPLGG